MDAADNSVSRRRFLGYLGAGAVGGASLALAACGGGSGGSSGNPAPTGGASSDLPSWLAAEAKPFKGRSITVIAQQQYFAQTNTDFANACARFAQLTGTTVNVATVNADTGNVIGKQDAAVKSGNVQDMAFLQGSRFPSAFQQLGDLEPVDDVVKDLVTRYGAMADCNKINLFINNHYWGIPYFALASGWFARKDWLAEKKIKLSSVKTFADARDVALELSDPAQQRYGWGMTTNRSGDGAGFILNVIESYGGAISSDDGKKVVFKSSQTQEAVSFLADLYTNSKYSKMLPPGVNSWGDTGNNQAWLAGIIGFTANQYSLYSQSKAQGNPVYPKTATFGGFTGPAVKEILDVGDCQAFMIFKGAKEPGLAKVLAKYLVYGQPLLTLVKDSVGQVLPAYADIWNSNPFYLKGDQAFKGQYATLTETLPIKSSSGFNFPQAPSPGQQAVQASYVLCDMMGSIIQKKASVKQAIDSANQQIVQVFEQQGLPQ
ncbi:MAG: extracellular solute-binding protein [Candidatus Dormiibacterota bacterium]